MIDLPPPFRPATPADAEEIVALYDMAGEGLPSYLWQGMASEGETAAEVARRRALRDEGAFSWRNAVVADAGGRAVAMLMGYPLGDGPEAIAPDYPAMFVPLQELENLACGRWYVNILATLPEHRGRGLAAGLIEVAEATSRRAGRRGLALITTDTNAGARRLYARAGFREAASRPIVKEGWRHSGRDWILLLRD